MLGENIRILRKQKGLSQEALAQQLNVVRQTISKWEKGLSVPDAEMLKTLAEIFEVPVSTLLGSKIEEKAEGPDLEDIAIQLAALNDQLANQAAHRRKVWKRVLIGILIALALMIAVWMIGYYFYRVRPRMNAVLTTTNIECTLNGESYQYSITYDKDFRIYYAGGDAFIADHVNAVQYDDANVLLAQIEDYFTDHGGLCKVE